MAKEIVQPKNLTMPTPADYSKDAIHTALMEYVKQHPLTRYSWIPCPIMAVWVSVINQSFLSYALLAASILF